MALCLRKDERAQSVRRIATYFLTPDRLEGNVGKCDLNDAAAICTLAQVEANNRHRAQTPRITLPDKPCTAPVNTTQH